MTDEPKIGRTVRVRLPNDYVVSDESAPHDQEPVTLDKFAIIQEARARFAIARAAENIMTENMLRDMLYMGYVPPTPWQRRWRAIKRFPRRVRDARRVLIGEASVYGDDY